MPDEALSDLSYADAERRLQQADDLPLDAARIEAILGRSRWRREAARIDARPRVRWVASIVVAVLAVTVAGVWIVRSSGAFGDAAESAVPASEFAEQLQVLADPDAGVEQRKEAVRLVAFNAMAPFLALRDLGDGDDPLVARGIAVREGLDAAIEQPTDPGPVDLESSRTDLVERMLDRNLPLAERTAALTTLADRSRLALWRLNTTPVARDSEIGREIGQAWQWLRDYRRHDGSKQR